MPSGRTHDRITWLLAAPAGALAWRATGDPGGACALVCAFVFAGLMFSGDLDLPSVQYRRWGLLRWIWKPYQWLIRHRSPLSHGILIGPLVRLVYLTAAIALMAAGALGIARWSGLVPEMGALGPGRWRLPAPDAGSVQLAVFALGGLWLGGASHTLADQLVSWLKRKRKRRRS